MSQVIIPYLDARGNKYGVFDDIGSQNVLDDFLYCVQNYPRPVPFCFCYATLADLQAVPGWEDAVAAPAGLVPRRVRLKLVNWWSVDPAGGDLPAQSFCSCIVGDSDAWNLIEPTGATPFPAFRFSLNAAGCQIDGATGEARSSN